MDPLPHPPDRPQRARHVTRRHARLAGHARVVAHPLLDHAEVPLARLGDQLGVDEEVGALDRDLVDHLAPEQLEGAVHVAYAHAEQEPHEPVVERGGDEARGGVVAVDAEADDHVVLPQQREQVLDLRDVELAVGVGVEDLVEAHPAEAGPQRGPVAEVALVAQQPQAWVVLRQERLHRVRRAVRAAVVDHDHLEVGHQVRQRLERLAHDDFDVRLLVVGRQHDREPREGCVGSQLPEEGRSVIEAGDRSGPVPSRRAAAPGGRAACRRPGAGVRRGCRTARPRALRRPRRRARRSRPCRG